MEKINTNSLNDQINYDELIKTYMDELRADKEVYELIKAQNMTIKEVKDNIAHLIEFKEDHNYCKNCPGLSKCEKKLPHFKTTIRFDKKVHYLYCNTTACEKYMDKVKSDSIYLRYEAPEEWKGIQIYNVKGNVTAGRKKIPDVYDALVENKAKWLYLIGGRKSGKSYILSAFGTSYAKEKNIGLSFVNAPSLFKELSALVFTNKEAFLNEMDELANTPILALDNFGNETINEFVRDNVVFPLLAERSELSLPTFFSSELSIKQIQALYSVGQTGGRIRAQQLASVIEANAIILNVGQADESLFVEKK